MITPLGTGTEKSWQGLIAGQSGISAIDAFDASQFDSKIAGQVRDFEPADFMPAKEIKKMDRFIHFSLAASDMAMQDAKLQVSPADAHHVGVLVGSGIGGLAAIEKYHKILLEKGPSRITPFFIPMVIINLTSGQVAMRFGCKGPNLSVVTACATGTHAIGEAARIIQRGDAKAMIAGGTEAVVTPLTIGGFAAMKALSTCNDQPQKASRPFDARRDGFVMGEGAGIVVLEELEYAKARGAKIYAELIGYGTSGDAYHISSPSPDGEGAISCMRNCLQDAGIQPQEVDYINAHGTSTPINDSLETMAIHQVFGQHASKVAISSTKSMTGHLLGAAGGVEAVICLLAMERGIIPPTINYEHPDPACDLDYVPNQARKQEVKVSLSNSFGFGGTNATLAFRKL
ncbi:MAG: beta-ketoacyl-ACP synthase II [Candidatus Schekmanbacteria bacterium]|nr:beta-ketoacyl-ACP synthase II [Candidatus Schekmanbacteria bacterium]